MAHAKPSELKDLGELLAAFRAVETLKEKSFGCFYRKSKGVLHFHLQKGRRYAHVFDGTRWVEVDLVEGLSVAKQKTLAARIAKLLAE